MIQNIPVEISLGSFSLIGILTGYIWNNQSKRIDKISKVQGSRPCNSIHLQIKEIQTDIKWIKDKLK